MEPSLFDQHVKQSLGFALASDLQDIPDEPGIYSWYLPLRGDTSGDLLRFLKTLQDNTAAAAPASSISGAGRQHRFLLERNPPTFNLASDDIQRLSERMTPTKVQALATATLILSFFGEPLYIGMAKALRTRLEQHRRSVQSFDEDIRWSGSFRTRIAHVLKEPNYLQRCLIAYLPMSSVDLGEESTRVLEHVLIHAIRPAHNIRS